MAADTLDFKKEADALFCHLEKQFGLRDRDALREILRAAEGARRSMRKARPTPREGVESALDLIAALARGALGEGP